MLGRPAETRGRLGGFPGLSNISYTPARRSRLPGGRASSRTWNERGRMTGKDATTLLREMIRIRVAEETVGRYYPEQEMRTPTHFSIGQEAIQIGRAHV